MIHIYPYKLASESARALRASLHQATGLRPLLVRPDGRFNPRRTDVIINWGNSSLPTSWEWGGDLNYPVYVKNATDKLLSFTYFKVNNVPTPDWTTNKEEAQNWLDSGSIIVVRHILNGHSGQGIEVVEGGNEQQLPQAPLYVKYKKRRSEWRVHIFKGEVIDTQQKRKRNQDARPDTFSTVVRNHSTGWVYCHDDISPDPRRDVVAIQAVEALGLDFGAVDIVYNEHEGQYYVLEVNSAPGTEGLTLQRYTEAILKL